MIQHDLHVELAILVQSGQVELGIDDLNIRIGQDVTGGDFALARRVDDDLLGALAVELANEALQVQDDLGHVLLHALDGGKLMEHTVDADGGGGHAGEAGEQHPTHGVAQRHAEAALQGFHHEPAISTHSSLGFSKSNILYPPSVMSFGEVEAYLE